MRALMAKGLAVAACMMGCVGGASAADLYSTPAVTATAPNTVDREWTLTLGGYVSAKPDYFGSNDYEAGFMPIIRISRADKLSEFRSYEDSPSIALIDTGVFELGPVVNMVWKRDASDNNQLRGMDNIDYAFEVGGYAQAFPAEWLRLRAEVRYGFGGYDGVVANIAADAIHFADFFGGMTISGGPRINLGSSGFTNTYFGVTDQEAAAAQALGNNLTPWKAGGGVYSVGLGGQLLKRFNENVTGTVFAEYQYLTADAGDSPLVVQNGDRNQIQVGVSLSYTFFLGIQ